MEQQFFTALAPMEGVTDQTFRSVVTHASRPDLYFTEFTNVKSFTSPEGRHNALERLNFAPEEMPIIAQIWGNTPADFAITAKGLRKMGYQQIDINMGCPERHVVATGGGSGLIKTPALATEIIDAVKTADLKVSVKTRLGYSKPEEWRDWLTHLLSQDLHMLTIHLRTKKEMSKVPAHWELIPDIISLKNHIAPQTILMFNGDFDSLAHFKQILADLKVKPSEPLGCMIGRGVFRNPYCFEPTPKTHSKEELFELLKYHLTLYGQNPNIPFQNLKRFFKIYINTFPGATDMRAKLMETTSVAEVREIIAAQDLKTTD